jgi:hypothetical protein
MNHNTDRDIRFRYQQMCENIEDIKLFTFDYVALANVTLSIKSALHYIRNQIVHISPRPARDL